VQGRWYYVTGVYDGDASPRLKLYVNGVLEATANSGLAGNIVAHSSSDRLNFGRLPSGYRLFTGTLDEVRIWKSALTQEQIRSQMCAAATQGNECASYWPLDAAGGADVADSGPAGVNGTFYTALVDVHSYDNAARLLYDEDKFWTVDGFTGMELRTVAGAGVDETTTITGNMENELRLATWGTNPILDDNGEGTGGGMTWYGIRNPSESAQWRFSDAPVASTGEAQILEGASDVQGIFASKLNSFPSSLLRISSADFGDSDRVLFGYLGEGLWSNTTNIPSNINHRLSRVWKLEVHTEDVRTGNFVFDVSDLLLRAGSEGDLRLLLDDNGDFGDAVVRTGTYDPIDSTFTVKLDLADGMFVTLASTTEFNALPVELDCFTAHRSGDAVVLAWRTVTEQNNFGFYVQRSSGDPRDWSDLGFVAGGGTSNTPRDYRFVDRAEAGAVWYRLRQVDRDGRAAYSEAVAVAALGDARDLRLALFPNPVRTDGTISFTLSEPGLVTATIVTTLGSAVETLCRDQALGAGTHWLPFDASALPGGMYVLQLRTATATVTRPVFVVK
jgi:hypothetical protein